MVLLNGLGRELVERLGWCLLHSVWQLAAVGVVAAIVLRGLRPRSAQARYLVACGALLAMIVLPVLTFAWQGPSPPAAGTSVILSMGPAADAPVGQTAELQRPPVSDRRERSPSEEWPLGRDVDSRRLSTETWGESFRPWFPWLVVVWVAGVSGLSLRLLGGWLHIHGLIRHHTRTVAGRGMEGLERLKGRMRIRGTVRLLESIQVQVPMAVGWLRPVILLPATALTGLPPDQIEAILAHELAHIGRYDYLVNLVQSMVETLLFYHPAAWWISGRIRVEREHCCDDRAVELCGDRVLYARALAALEERRGASWLLAVSARDGSLLERIRRLLGVSAPEKRAAGGLAGTLALAVVSVLGAVILLAPATSQARAGVEPGEAITGTVVAADGRPVAGAKVWLVAHSLLENSGFILSKARTDGGGRFRLIPMEEPLKRGHLGWRALWAYKPGKQLATIVSRDNVKSLGFDPARPVSLTLGESASASFRVVDPEGKPIAGTEIALNRLDEGFAALPGELADELAVRTDPDGRATLIGAPLDRIRGVQIRTESLGTQYFHAHFGFKPDQPLRLRSAMPVEGRVTADDVAAVRNLTLSFLTFPEEGRDLTRLIPQGQARIVTDGQGRFRIPALATGRLQFWTQGPEDWMYRTPRLDHLEVRAGERAELVIALLELIHVRGLVREKGTGKPVAGVRLSFSSTQLSENPPAVKTDSDGRYQALALPDPKGYCHISELPKAYLKQTRRIEMTIDPIDGETLPPIELDRGVTLRGVVIDESGQPVPGAAVEGKWIQFGESFKAANGANGVLASNLSSAATSNDQGQFVLEGINPGANVMLEASVGNARTERPQPAAAGAATPVKLVISGANTVALFGHVVDPAGKPVAGAMVRIHSRPIKDDGHPDPGPTRFDEGEIRTDRDGRFLTPRQVKRGYGYRAEVKSGDESLMPDSTPWLAIKSDTRPFFPRLVLRRLRTVHGRVVDSAGKPVAGGSVRQSGDGPARTATVTDADGRFALPGVLAEPAFIFIVKSGYRFQGKAIGADDSAVDVSMAREEEPLPKPMTTLPPRLTRAEELALLHRAFDGYAERAIKEGGANERFEVLRVLIDLDRTRAMELLNDERLEPWQTNNLRLDLGKRMVREDYDEARGLIEAIRDSNMRSYADSEASVALPDTERPHKLELLDESLIAGRAVIDPASRVLRLADIGERLLDLGRTEQATQVLREGQAIAVKLPTTGTSAWARGKLAEELAPIDIPAALSLLEGTEQGREYGQYLGHIAHELAARNPAEAERVLMMVPDVWPNFRDNYTQRVCYRMAAVDPKRAAAMAAGMRNYRQKARALGAMALAVARTKGDHATATQLLDEAFAALDAAVVSDQDDWDGLGMACTAAAGLLPIVEQVDARRVPEFLWRTLALRPALPGPRGRDGIADLAAARVAAMAARYDRAIARQILNGYAERALADRVGLDDWGSMFRDDSVFQAAAIVEPARAVAMIESLPEAIGPAAARSLKNTARMAFARVLARQGIDRWDALDRSLMHLWRIDSEED